MHLGFMLSICELFQTRTFVFLLAFGVLHRVWETDAKLPAVSNRTWIVQELLTSGAGAVYFNLRIHNYTDLIELPETKSLYVVGNGNTLLRLHSDDLRHLTSFRLPSKPSVSLCMGNPEAPCEEQAAFNLLSKTQDGQNLWYCYIYQTSYMKNTIIPNVDSARCEIPTPITLEPSARLVQWENSVYSSLDLRKPGVYLMANDGFLYTAGWFHGAMHIHRVLLPNFNGLPNWDQFLTTPDSPDFIREPATFITAFETDEEVYFLFRESQLQTCSLKVLNRASDQPFFPSKQSQTHEDDEATKHTGTVTRLARVCKGDRGGYVYVNEGEFVTFAKATMECVLRSRMLNRSQSDAKSGDDRPDEEYAYTHAEAASWDPMEERLYVTFGTSSGHPRGLALCIYTKQSIEQAFESDLLSSNLADDSDPTKTIPNKFPNICSRFSSNTLTEMELDQGRRLPRGYLLRAKPIQPIGNQPILVRPKPGQPLGRTELRNWKHVTVDHVGSSTVLYLATNAHVERYRILTGAGRVVDNPRACFIDRFQVGDGNPTQEAITGLYLPKRFPASEFYILSTKHVIKLSVTGMLCSRYANRANCLDSGNPYCVWDESVGLCEITTFVVPNGRQPDHSGPINRKESAIWLNQLDGGVCDQQPLDDQFSQFSWWNALSKVTLNGVEGPHAALPCVQLNFNPNADGSQQNLTCWCRPCRDCAERGQNVMEIVNCTIQPSWSPWSPWSACSTSCGNGVRTRTRRCDSPGPMLIPLPNGSIVQWRCESNVTSLTNSPDQEIQLEQCSLHPICPQDEKPFTLHRPNVINYGKTPFVWTAWSSCSSDCGLGVRIRHLKCREGGDNSTHTPDMNTCAVVGPGATESELCRNTTCPLSEVFTKWTEWFRPPTKRVRNSIDPTSRRLRQRLRFACHAPNATVRDLRIGRVQFMERQCAPWNGICTPVSSTNEWSTLEFNPLSSAVAGSSSFESPSSAALGHWSSWSPWTPCNQACVPPVSVVAAVNRVIPVTPYSAPLYLHGGMQSRRRTCLFASVYDCPGGPSQSNESRTCPPVPACHTDWSCWSDWSSCQAQTTKHDDSLIYSYSQSNPVRCEWKADGMRKRVRQCVLGQGDWLANRPPSCSGPMDETESCPRLVGKGTAICPPEQDVHWSLWSAWTSCAEPAMLRPRVGTNRVIVPSPNQLEILRFRTRRCVTPDNPVTIKPRPVGTGVCAGSWKQIRTCPMGAIRMVSAIKPSTQTQKRDSQFTILQVLFIGSMAFLIAAFLVALILILIHCTWCAPCESAHKTVRRTSNVYDQAEGTESDVRFAPSTNSRPGHGLSVPTLTVSGPPQPLLTLPTPVKVDMIKTRRNGNPFGRNYVPQAVYDSVASQDLPTTFSLTENPFELATDPYPQNNRTEHSPLFDPHGRNYWSLPRPERPNRRSLTNGTKPGDYMYDDQFHSFPQNSRTIIEPHNVDDLTPSFHSPEQFNASQSDPERQQITHESANSRPHSRRPVAQTAQGYPTEGRPQKTVTGKWKNRAARNDPKQMTRDDGRFIDPTKPLFPEDHDSYTQASVSSSQPSVRTNPSIDMVPPSMPLLPVRYPGADQTSDQSQSPIGDSVDSSLDWGPETSSGRSEIYSICFERPQNPHLRDPSSQEPSPTERGRSAHNS